MGVQETRQHTTYRHDYTAINMWRGGLGISAKNFCFVSFRSSADAERALNALDGQYLGDQQVTVEYRNSTYVQRNSHAPSSNLTAPDRTEAAVVTGVTPHAGDVTGATHRAVIADVVTPRAVSVTTDAIPPVVGATADAVCPPAVTTDATTLHVGADVMIHGTDAVCPHVATTNATTPPVVATNVATPGADAVCPPVATTGGSPLHAGADAMIRGTTDAVCPHVATTSATTRPRAVNVTTDATTPPVVATDVVCPPVATTSATTLLVATTDATPLHAGADLMIRATTDAVCPHVATTDVTPPAVGTPEIAAKLHAKWREGALPSYTTTKQHLSALHIVFWDILFGLFGKI